MEDQKLTTRQKEVFRFLSGYIQKNGFPPTVREIARHFRFAGPKGAKKHLDLLEKKGFIQRLPKSPRAIELIQPRTPSPDTLLVPLVGQVNAGTPSPAAENIQGYFSLDRRWLSKRGVPQGRSEGAFVLRVRGQSMIDAHILDGDYVVAVPAAKTRNGEIVVVLIGKEATLKRFYQAGRTIRLKPANSRMAEIIVPASQEVRILGKVVFVFRTLD